MPHRQAHDSPGPFLLARACPQEEPQLREQEYGNFTEAQAQARAKLERLEYGRFFYRFSAGESAADVYDRITLFQVGVHTGREGQG